LRGFWAITDQGLFAGSNFVFNILAARWLSVGEYGTFAFGFAFMWLLGSIHTALLTEPLLVYGPGRYNALGRKYVSAILWGHWVFTLSTSVLILLFALLSYVIGFSAVAPTAIGLAVATPFVLFQWLIRRACYVYGGPRVAAGGGVVYLVVILTSVISLYKWNEVSVFRVFVVLGLANLLAGTWIWSRLKLTPAPMSWSHCKNLFRDHWAYGRWALVTNLLVWSRGHIYFLLLPIWGGFQATGTLKAVFNLLIPLAHVNVALGTVLLPPLVRIRSQTRFRPTVALAAGTLTLPSLAYFVVIIFAGSSVLDWLYIGKYQPYADLLVMLGLLPVFSAITTAISTALRAIERPDREFWAHAVAAVFTMTVGLILTATWGVRGAGIGWLLSHVIVTVAVLVLFSKPDMQFHSNRRHHRTKPIETIET
jgi:O-antigen/teichoic acid export membrane protein